jgi:hypothetical protein
LFPGQTAPPHHMRWTSYSIPSQLPRVGTGAWNPQDYPTIQAEGSLGDESRGQSSRKKARRTAPDVQRHGEHVAFSVLPQLVDGVNDKQSFTMFNVGWVLPEGSSRRRHGKEKETLSGDSLSAGSSHGRPLSVPSPDPHTDGPQAMSSGNQRADQAQSRRARRGKFLIFSKPLDKID